MTTFRLLRQTNRSSRFAPMEPRQEPGPAAVPEPARDHLTAFGKDLAAAVGVLRTDPKQGRALLDAAIGELAQGLPK